MWTWYRLLRFLIKGKQDKHRQFTVLACLLSADQELSSAEIYSETGLSYKKISVALNRLEYTGMKAVAHRLRPSDSQIVYYCRDPAEVTEFLAIVAPHYLN